MRNSTILPESLHLPAKIRREADGPSLRDRRVHEPADGGDGFGPEAFDVSTTFSLLPLNGPSTYFAPLIGIA
jgi:hypothetical protein